MAVSGDGTARTGLGGPGGYGEIMVPRSDDGSLRLDLSAIFEDGLNYLGTRHDAASVFVNSNGTLSFGSAFADYPTAANGAVTRDLIAPFWGDVDTRLDGEGAESGAIWVDLDSVTGTVSVTWDDVGVYRRNAETTNTFQLQLIDRGAGDFDIVFRYESIGWIRGSGQDDAGAYAGLASARLIDPAWLFEPPGADGMAQLAAAAGNSGVAGLWLHEMRGGSAEGLRPVPGSLLRGTGGDDRLQGSALADYLAGGDGHDTLIGLAGDDTLIGGAGPDDLRDVVYGGEGHDSIDGGYGNDELRGDGGNDTVSGGFGTDTVIGGDGDDVLTGQAWSDVIYGNDGSDFINGGFGYDRVNGGTGADKFFHLGVADHGSDWIQDYSAAEGDLLLFGGAATIDQFQLNLTETANAGEAGVEDAFVIYRPTGQILWALVDGGGEAEINLRLDGVDHDLLT